MAATKGSFSVDVMKGALGGTGRDGVDAKGADGARAAAGAGRGAEAGLAACCAIRLPSGSLVAAAGSGRALGAAAAGAPAGGGGRPPAPARRYPTARIANSRAEVDADTHEAKLSVDYDSGPAYRFGPLRVEGSERYGPEGARRLARLPTGPCTAKHVCSTRSSAWPAAAITTPYS